MYVQSDILSLADVFDMVCVINMCLELYELGSALFFCCTRIYMGSNLKKKPK